MGGDGIATASVCGRVELGYKNRVICAHFGGHFQKRRYVWERVGPWGGPMDGSGILTWVFTNRPWHGTELRRIRLGLLAQITPFLYRAP